MKTTTQLKPQTPPAAMPAPAPLPLAAAPDWVIETPEEPDGPEYNLVMQDADLNWEQEVLLTRAEYIALKQHLAGLRGLNSGPAAPSVTPEAPPLAGLDPLRAGMFHDLQPDQDQILRVQLMGMVMKALVEMGTSEIQGVAQFIDLSENDQGCVTPVEDFITGLVRHHYIRGLTPDDAVHEIESCEGFRVNYNECLESSRRFIAMYPEAVKSAA